MRLRIVLALIIFGTGVNAHCQSIIRSNVGAAGSSQLIISGNTSYFVSQSIGQASVIGTSNAIRQGFQQPQTLFIARTSATENEYLASVYPNPFSQSISVAFAREITQDITISIFDMNGRIVHYQNYSPTQLVELPIRGVANGVYRIHVLVGANRYTTSLIKISP